MEIISLDMSSRSSFAYFGMLLAFISILDHVTDARVIETNHVDCRNGVAVTPDSTQDLEGSDGLKSVENLDEPLKRAASNPTSFDIINENKNSIVKNVLQDMVKYLKKREVNTEGSQSPLIAPTSAQTLFTAVTPTNDISGSVESINTSHNPAEKCLNAQTNATDNKSDNKAIHNIPVIAGTDAIQLKATGVTRSNYGSNIVNSMSSFNGIPSNISDYSTIPNIPIYDNSLRNGLYENNFQMDSFGNAVIPNGPDIADRQKTEQNNAAMNMAGYFNPYQTQLVPDTFGVSYTGGNGTLQNMVVGAGVNPTNMYGNMYSNFPSENNFGPLNAQQRSFADKNFIENPTINPTSISSLVINIDGLPVGTNINNEQLRVLRESTDQQFQDYGFRNASNITPYVGKIGTEMPQMAGKNMSDSEYRDRLTRLKEDIRMELVSGHMHDKYQGQLRTVRDLNEATYQNDLVGENLPPHNSSFEELYLAIPHCSYSDQNNEAFNDRIEKIREEIRMDAAREIQRDTSVSQKKIMEMYPNGLNMNLAQQVPYSGKSDKGVVHNMAVKPNGFGLKESRAKLEENFMRDVTNEQKNDKLSGQLRKLRDVNSGNNSPKVAEVKTVNNSSANVTSYSKLPHKVGTNITEAEFKDRVARLREEIMLEVSGAVKEDRHQQKFRKLGENNPAEYQQALTNVKPAQQVSYTATNDKDKASNTGSKLGETQLKDKVANIEDGDKMEESYEVNNDRNLVPMRKLRETNRMKHPKNREENHQTLYFGEVGR